MSTSNSQNRIEWEKRAELLGANLNSVLLKNTPTILNQHLHNWHRCVIFQYLREEQKRMRILDVGCGYGRLSAELLDEFANIDVTGIDISQTFAKLYKETLKRPVVVGTVDDIPLSLGHFDFIICVTVLMYVDERKFRNAITNLLACLKKGGTLIIIENDQSGTPFLTGFGIGKFVKHCFRKTDFRTRDYSFEKGRIRNSIIKTGGTVKSEHRLPVTTLLFLPLQFIARCFPPWFGTRILNIITCLDGLLSKSPLPSMWVAYIVELDQDRECK